MTDALLDIRGLSIPLPGGADRRHAVSDLSLGLRRGEVVCVVGESGSGKSLTALAAMGLLPRNFARPTGQVLFEGRDLLT
ncbi:ATP-binding cassette domain-containing protein, partial [Mycobacterium tuberculosis]|nr:ATP-binding cassette domain-containing protein [Mycobacterium tuberculosis]